MSYWISPAHMNYAASEATLIQLCGQTGSVSKKEFFHGLDFASVVDVATQLPFTRIEDLS